MPGVAPARRRLEGLGGKNGTFKPIPRPAKTSECGCDNPSFEVIEGAKICLSCGTQVSEQNIVSEVTFGESASGAATVEGGMVNENSRHAKTLGAAAARRLGASMQTREETENNGREALRLFTGRLPVAPDISDQAMNIWKLASNINFIQGRRADEVAGACLYAACRRDKENTILLMDIAEIITVNVFSLGDTYKALSKLLYMDVKEPTKIIEVEPLILKYASKLEFGEKTRQVAEDAVKIIRRMKRDWIVTGRHPAGLCGACIILAARMNNFRRTVREVVFVTRVADLTITKRLEEFKRTRSGVLTVDEFRTVGNRIKYQHDPPALYEAELKAKKMLEKKRKRQERAQQGLEISEDGSAASSRQSSITPDQESSEQPEAAPAAKRQKMSSARSNATVVAQTQREPRRDADGFVIPEIPIDPALRRAGSVEQSEQQTSASPEPTEIKKTKTVRKKKEKVPPPPALTDEDLVAEGVLEDEIEHILRERECISSKEETEKEKIEGRSKTLAEQQRAMAAQANAQRRAATGHSASRVSDSEIIGEDEFENDPEVRNALLSEEQVRVKEMIWVKHNEDWLRSQQTKQLKRALEEAEGKTDKRQTKRRKRGRMGDGTVLTEGGTPVESPADASRRMLEKRAPKGFSQRVNYAALGKIYGDKNHSESRDTSEPTSTPAHEAPDGSHATSPVPSELATGAPEALEESHVASPAASEQAHEHAVLPTPEATQQIAQVDKRKDIEKPNEDEPVEEEEEDDDDEEDYWPDEGNQPSPQYHEDEDDFEAAQEDVTGDFGMGEYDDGDGYEEY